MPCYHPLKAWYGRGQTKNGKRPIVFKMSLAADPFGEESLELPCGQCHGCRLDRSREWAMRCMHEKQLHDHSCFLTLTYDNEHLPKDLSLEPIHLTNFLKRLRKKLHPIKIRYFACGEYGDETKRAHYHLLLFGYDFTDKKLWKIQNGHRLYTSQLLSETWGMGHCLIGNVTFESSAYVARYVMKKRNGKNQKKHYQFIDDQTGEIHQVEPEFVRMSRRPGIAHDWYQKFKTDCYPKDSVTVNGRRMKPAKYYDRIFDTEDPETLEKIKEERVKNAKAKMADGLGERLKVREKLQLLKLKKLKRTLA